ncbi:carboxypeptidase-like regulatory domain-containing protein [uncultured Alistipes sp.]|jgi:putative tonB-dependent outer membrane receptor protein|nr:carboxypeptidase-like regulatory domain-containing protein [uncultured Alistipes sp.]
MLPGMLRAQQTTAAQTDSISIEKLINTLRQSNSEPIYAVIDQPFMVSAAIRQGATPLQQLEEALAKTPYRVSRYGNAIFVLRNTRLVTSFHPGLALETMPAYSEDLYTRFTGAKEWATSENKVYPVGDVYSKENPAQVKFSGQIIDFKTNEPLSGINVVARTPWTAAITDKNGNFTMTLPGGRHQLEISGVNIKNTRRQLMLYGNGTLDIAIEEEQYLLDEVVISGRIQNVKSTQIGVEKLQISKIKNIPMALGEVDVLRVIQSLPGVKTVGEASTGFNVRGGATDQNLILLNDGTIYNPNHLFGFFTAFSSDMVQDAAIYKSSIPASYGGRISSVLDITGKEANKEKFTGSAGIGLVTSKLNLEIPLVKERASLLLSGRATYSDWILGVLPKKSGYNDGKAGFYDMGLVYTHQLNDKNKINVYGYYSRDRFSFNKNEKYGYSNMNASVKWRRVFNEKLAGYFTVGLDHYDYKNIETVEEPTGFKLTFNINEFFVKADFSYALNDKHKLDFGFKSMFYNINSGKYEPHGKNSLVERDALQKDKALETAFYVGDEWEITPKLSVNAGVRLSMFSALGPREYYKYQSDVLPHESTVIDTVRVGGGKPLKTYFNPEFRLSARYAFNDRMSVKVGFNSMTQYIHKLSNTVIMSPTDTWKLSDYNIKPQRGWQVAGGFYLNSQSGIWEYSVEGYYKRMKNYLDYRSKAQLLMNHHIETDVIATQGHAYGVEVLVRKVTGKLNGWVSYAYSRTFLRQNNKLITNPVNDGDWYPTEYDKPHDFKFVGNYKFTERISISVNVDYSTGRPITIPAGQYYDKSLQSIRVYYMDRNSYRIPDYFRTDISFNIEPTHKKTRLIHSSFSVGVYNATGRKNIYSVYYVSEDDKIKGYKMSIFGAPIPFITYNMKF